MRPLLCVVLLVVLFACKANDPDPTPEPTPVAGTVAIAAAASPTSAPVNPVAEGCAAWTAQHITRVGDTLYVVELLDPRINNLALKKAAAENRARAEALKFLTGKNEGIAPTTTGQEQAECGGSTYVRMAFSALR